MKQVRLLTLEEFGEAEAARIALATKRGADPDWLAANKTDYGWASISEVAGPCVMWQCPWYHDPKDPEDQKVAERVLAAYAAGEKKTWMLSRFYWQQWSSIRPPLSVICPNGVEWCVDQVSSNGEGWTVTFDGDWQNGLIHCAPSIDVPGYHGFLGMNGAPAGYFSDPV
jgi:hypothetical protein